MKKNIFYVLSVLICLGGCKPKQEEVPVVEPPPVLPEPVVVSEPEIASGLEVTSEVELQMQLDKKEYEAQVKKFNQKMQDSEQQARENKKEMEFFRSQVQNQQD